MEIHNIASEIADRRISAESLAYRYAYEKRFKEAVPEGEHPEDAYFYRSLDEKFDADGKPRASAIGGITTEEIMAECEESAREFGHYILYHDEFNTWLAHDISECSLIGKDIEVTLEKLKPQLKDVLDAQYLVDLMDAALAKPAQIPEGLIGFFSPGAPPPFRRTQLKRARKWAVEQRSHFEEHAKASQGNTQDKGPIKKEKSPIKKVKAPLTLSSCLVTSRLTQPQLDELLVNIGLLDRLESGLVWAKEPQKAWQWASLRAALKDRLLLKDISHARAVEVFRQAYGAKVSKGTMSFEPDLGKENIKLPQNAFYSRLMRLLPDILPTK